MAERVQGASPVESNCLNDERLCFPPSRRVSHPRRVGIFGQLAAIEINLPRWIAGAGYHNDLLGSLNELESVNKRGNRYAGRQTLGDDLPILHTCDRFRPQWLLFGFQPPKHIDEP